MKHQLYRKGNWGIKDLGWLQSRLCFSFSDFKQPNQSGFGLLRVFNDDRVAPGKGFGLHAHQNMEIISILLQGSMNHKDTLGYNEVMEAGAVQVMSAGSGLRHEEYNVGEEEVRFLQIWVEPKLNNITPRYQRRHFSETQRRNRLLKVVSYEPGTAHCWTNQFLRIHWGWLEQGKKENYHTYSEGGTCSFVYMISGGMEVNDIPLLAGDGLGLWDTENIVFNPEQESTFVVIEVPINH